MKKETLHTGQDTSQTTRATDPDAQTDEMLIDTSKMNEGKVSALELTEAARGEALDTPSFAGQLFMGVFKPETIFPFPEQTAEEKKIGDDLVAKVSLFLQKNLDADKVDDTRTIPPKIIVWYRCC